VTRTGEVRAAFRSDVGKQRELNEDAAFAGRHVFAVADGLGGHRAGEVASTLALESIAKLDELDARKAADGAADAVRRANRSVLERAERDDSLTGMGTTMTVLVIDETSNAHLAHVGDSRAYMIRSGEIMQLSRDHTLVARMVAEGKLTPEQAEQHPQRSILTRALGADREVDVEEATIALAPGDRLLLCSDGLTGVLGDDDILRIAGHGEDLDRICARLVDEANARGGPDNITAVLVELAGATGAAALPMPRTFARKSDVRTRRRIPVRPFIWLLVVAVLAAGGYYAVRALTNNTFFVGVDGQDVAVFRGLPLKFAGLDFARVEQRSAVRESDVRADFVPKLKDGVHVKSVQDGLDYIANDLPRARPSPAVTAKPSARATPRASARTTARRT
jgi:protein phosphatase